MFPVQTKTGFQKNIGVKNIRASTISHNAALNHKILKENICPWVHDFKHNFI